MKSTATANPVLTQVGVDFMQGNAAFASGAISPIFLTAEQSANYYKIDKDNILDVPESLRRAPSSDYHRSAMKVSDDMYACQENGHEEPLDDRERKKYQNFFAADRAATERGTSIVLLNREREVKALVTGAGVTSASPGTKWDASGGDPIADVQAAREVIRKQIGLLPNTMVMSNAVFNALEVHPDILDRIKYTQMGLVTPQLLASLFRVGRVVIAGGLYNSANEGQAMSVADIWGDSVVLAYVNPAQDLRSPTFCRTFAWTGEVGPDGYVVETYREDKIRSDIFRCREDIDHKLTVAGAGYHLSDTLT